MLHFIFFFFFFNDTATTEIYTLSLHDALPISARYRARGGDFRSWPFDAERHSQRAHVRLLLRASVLEPDRKSTRLNSSHQIISYAVFCLKKKKKISEHKCLSSV